MQKNIFKTSVIVAALFIFATSYSQSPEAIVIQSKLTDINGDFVQVRKVDISLSVLNSSGVNCFEKSKSLVTDNKGDFILLIEDVPELFVDGSGSDPAVIQLSITSPEKDTWLEEDKFLVKYLLTISGSEAYPEYTLTRMEGQKLNYEYRSDIWKFSDLYPFAYLKCTFLLSFNNEITDAESLLMAAQGFFGESDDSPSEDVESEAPSPPASRGLKGGYAVGGLKKK